MLNSTDRFFGELVSPADSLYKISNYQRFYVWNEGKVDTYLNDIILTLTRRETDKSVMHYFGQTILLETDEDRRGRKTFEVIDGQQRLTTFLMFVASLYGKSAQLAESHPEIKDTAEAFQKKCKNYLQSEKPNAEIAPKLILSETDNAYFASIISSLRNGCGVEKHSCPESHKRLYAAQSHICERINSIVGVKATAAESLTYMDRILDTAADAFQVVVIKPKAERHTYQLYQVVNDRGEPLTEGELLKAKSIEVLANNKDYVAKARDFWDDILKDPGSKTDEYLKWCYMSKVGDEKSQDRYYRAFLETYFHLADNTIITEEIQAQFMEDLTDLYRDIEVCRKLDQGIWPYDEADSTADEWKKSVLSTLVVGRKHKLCIPVLLSAYVQNKDQHIKTAEKNFFSYLEICETFFVLVKGVFAWREDRLKERYLEAARKMRKPKEKFQSQQFKALLAEIDPKLVEEECLQKLKNLTYAAKGDNSLMKHLCILLETYWGCFEKDGRVYTSRVPDGTNLVYKELSLEHIYPESAPDGTKDEVMAANKHRLGNLLIYGRKENTKLRNKPYALKREAYTKSRFTTVSTVGCSVQDWTHEEFEKRHNDVCEKLKALLLRFYSDDRGSPQKADQQAKNNEVFEAVSAS
jgi:hypothetical protein